jgi:hypothetical protein
VEVVAARISVAGVLLALACTSAAFAARADNPTVRINAADQTKADAAVLRLKDFGGLGWTGGSRKPSKLTAPSCPGFDPKESDLVVTGHAAARFTNTRGALVVDQDTQVLETSAAVQKDFARSLKPELPGCLAYQLKASGQGQIVSVSVRPLALRRLGEVSAAYRATIVLTVQGHKVKFVSDYVFFGQGRYEYSLFVQAPVVLGDELVPFETEMAQILVRRGGVNVA